MEDGVERSLESKSTDNGFFRHESDREVLELFRPSPDVVLFRVLGRMSGEAARRGAEALEAALDGESIYMFVDMMAMTSYEPEARRALTDWVSNHPSQIKHAWFCTTHKVVEMGISVGSMVVGMAGVKVELLSNEAWLGELGRRLD